MLPILDRRARYSATQINFASRCRIIAQGFKTLKVLNASVFSPFEASSEIFSKNDDLLVLVYPVKDTDEYLDNSAELSSLRQRLKELDLAALQQRYPDKTLRIVIPVAETWIRAHWVLVDVILKPDGSASAQLYDSKSLLGWLYPVKYISKVLQENFNIDKLDCYYLWHQALLNNYDCGRYVSSYIADIAFQNQLDSIYQPSATAALSEAELQDYDQKVLSELVVEYNEDDYIITPSSYYDMQAALINPGYIPTLEHAEPGEINETITTDAEFPDVEIIEAVDSKLVDHVIISLKR